MECNTPRPWVPGQIRPMWVWPGSQPASSLRMLCGAVQLTGLAALDSETLFLPSPSTAQEAAGHSPALLHQRASAWPCLWTPWGRGALWLPTEAGSVLGVSLNRPVKQGAA